MDSNSTDDLETTQISFGPSEVMRAKANLMSRAESKQTFAVEWILEEFGRFTSIDERDKFINQLIDTNTIYILCGIISNSFGPIFHSMLDIINIVQNSPKFYKESRRAIHAILRPATPMLLNPEFYHDLFTKILYTFFVILDGATKAGYPIDEICDSREIIQWLVDLKVEKSPKYLVRAGAPRVLSIIMSQTQQTNDEKQIALIYKAFDDCLRSNSKIISGRKDGHSFKFWDTSLSIILDACKIGARYCVGYKGDEFAASIKLFMTESLIPNFQATEIESIDFEVNLKNFLECLKIIFELKKYDQDLSECLAKNGYLKYLIEKSPESLDKFSSCVLSRVIAKLSEEKSLEVLDDNNAEFFLYLEAGFTKLISEIRKSVRIGTLVATPGAVSDALIQSIYHHFQAFHEDHVVPLSSMVRKISELSDTQRIPVLKATWLCFAASESQWTPNFESLSELTSQKSDDAPSYTSAVKRLADLLQSNDPRKCYTNDQRILDHGLNCALFPSILKRQIVQLWLEFDGDLEPLLVYKNSEILPKCLVSIVAECSGKLVNNASKLIKILIRDEQQSDEIRVELWKQLNKLLKCCTFKNATNVKSMLKLVRKTKPAGNLEVTTKSTVSILYKVLDNEALDDELKILLIKHVYVLLEIFRINENSEAVKYCVNDIQLLTTLRDKGFARENFQLSAVCIQFLVSILRNQEDFKIQCPDQGSITIEPLRIIVLMMRSDQNLSRAAIELLMLLISEKSATLSVVLIKFENDELAFKSIFTWYRTVLHLLPQTRQDDWYFIISSMMKIIRYSTKFQGIVKKLINYRGNCDFVKFVIEHNYKNSIFFGFIEMFHSYSTKYRTALRGRENLCERLDHFCLCDTLLRETMIDIKKYIEKLPDSDA